MATMTSTTRTRPTRVAKPARQRPDPTQPQLDTDTTRPNPIRPNTDPTDRGPTQPNHNSKRRRPDPTRSDPTPTRPTYLSVGSVLGRIGLGRVVSVSSCGWVGSGLCRAGFATRVGRVLVVLVIVAM